MRIKRFGFYNSLLPGLTSPALSKGPNPRWGKASPVVSALAWATFNKKMELARNVLCNSQIAISRDFVKSLYQRLQLAI